MEADAGLCVCVSVCVLVLSFSLGRLKEGSSVEGEEGGTVRDGTGGVGQKKEPKIGQVRTRLESEAGTTAV